MIKSTRCHLILSLLGGMLSSCVYYTPTVPDMPYQGTAGRTTYPDTWVTTQPTGIQQAPIPDPVTSQPITTANAPLDLTQPITPGTQSMVPTPAKTSTTTAKPKVTEPAPTPNVTKPAATAQTTSTASKPVDMSQITNTGPIPVATRVPGDPTRVYNPLNPSKTIRVVDKNGNPYPSGKELKVRGTNFHFYVP